jgi:hypothetical protein
VNAKHERKPLHFARAHQPLIDVVRVDDPAYKRPLLIETTDQELRKL